MKLLIGAIGFMILCVAIAFIVGNPDAKDTEASSTDSANVASTPSSSGSSAPTTPSAPPSSSSSPSPSPQYKMNEDVAVGNFVYNVTKAAEGKTFDSGYGEEKTDEKFVVLVVKIKNDDKTARDISTNEFKLVDSEGRKFDAYDDALLDSDKFLKYETINPGLSRTRAIVFETPEDASGFKLVAESGVLLAGGESEEIAIENISK